MILIFILQILAALPAGLYEWIARVLVLLLWPLARRERRLTAANIRLVYNLPPHSEFSKLFIRQTMFTQVLITLETIKSIFRPDQIHIEGLRDAKDLIRRGTQNSGSVVITAHLGSWELAGHIGAISLETPFHVLAKPSKAKWVTPLLDDLRQRLRMKVLWTDSKTLLRDMFEIVRRKEHLGFVMDQRPGKKTGGHPCLFMRVPNTPIVSGPALVAARENLPVFSIYMVRVGSMKYRCVAKEILPLGHGIKDEAVLSQMMSDDMSRVIELYTEQWSWNYKRWPQADVPI